MLFDELKGAPLVNEEKTKVCFSFTNEELEWKTVSFYEDRSFVLEQTHEYTYIMEDKVNACYKIGKTKNSPTLRLQQLRTANPHVNFVIAFPAMLYSEAELHVRFKSYKKDLEWFFATEEMKTFVANESTEANKYMTYYKLNNDLKLLGDKLFNK